MRFRGTLPTKVHATTITKKHIQVGSAKMYDTSSSTFSLFGVGASLHLRFFLPIFRCPPTTIFYMFSLLHLRQSFSQHGLTISVSLLLLSRLCLPHLPCPALHDTNLIYPGIIGQQASGFEVRRCLRMLRAKRILDD